MYMKILHVHMRKTLAIITSIITDGIGVALASSVQSASAGPLN
jgi:hypothetical protein